jgi:5'-nucleotidase (lipoprotein e(P4) family)
MIIKHIKIIITLLVFLVFTLSCKKKNKKLNSHDGLTAVLWVQKSAEYKALSTQIYTSAMVTLKSGLENTGHSAELTQIDNFVSLTPAIIMDIDDTILSGTTFQADVIKNHTAFTLDNWFKWLRRANAQLVPGAKDFIDFVRNSGVKIFFVTNRNEEFRKVTIKNLGLRGIIVDKKAELLMVGQKPHWNKSKLARRKFIAREYRIVLLVGDDLNDFLPSRKLKGSERDILFTKHKDKWGVKWIIIPNPYYGSWQESLSGSSEKNLIKTRLNHLKTN